MGAVDELTLWGDYLDEQDAGILLGYSDGTAMGSSSPVTFPSAPLRIRVELLLGSLGWTDVSARVLYQQGVTITRGLRPEQRKTSVAQCSLTFRNNDQQLSPRNVNGLWYGKFRKNTPIKVWFNPGSGDSLRFTGKVPSWAPAARGHPSDRSFSITAYGRRNSLQQGEEPLQSAQYRYLNGTTHLHYRSLESTGSGYVDGAPGSGQVPDLAQGGVFSDYPAAGPATSWRVEIDARFPLDKGAVTSGAAIRWNTDGTYGEWRIGADSTQGVFSYTAQATGAQTTTGTGVDVYDGVWHHWQVDATQNGANVDLVVRIDNTAVITTSIAATLGKIGFWLAQDDSPASGADRMPAIGHVIVYGPIPSTSSSYSAFRGWSGETPTARWARLLGEEGIPYAVNELVVDDQLMGPQGRLTLSALLDECEATAEGLIDETFADALRLSSRSAWWNQALALTLAYGATPSQIQPPMTPTDTTALTINDWTITRDGGAAAHAQQLYGPLNINDPEDDAQGVGPLKDSATLSLNTDDLAAQHAAYRVARDTIDEPWMPDTRFNLAAAPTLIPGWLACDIGSRTLLVDPPADAGPGDLDQILWGYVEYADQANWNITAYFGPGSIYQQAVYNGPLPRYDCAGTTLAEDLDTTETGIDVAITDTCAWAHDDGDYEVVIDGETVTVTAVSAVGGSYPARTQTLTVTRSTNGVVATHNTGTAVHVLHTARYAL